MIVHYVKNDIYDEALQLFCQMQLKKSKLDFVTIGSVLLACARITTLQLGKEMHSYIIRNGFMLVILLGNALIDMFSKCSDIEDARQGFDKFSSRNQGKS